jgi:uncharacterized protein YchJ
MGIEVINERDKGWTGEVAALLKSGWLGIGYTVVNHTTARKRLALAWDAESQSALKEWLRDRQDEGYVVAIRYYVAKSPCPMKNSEFKGPVLMRHSSFGCEVIAELLPLTLNTEGRNALVEGLGLRNVTEEFALLTNASRLGSRIAWFGDRPRGKGPRTRNGACPCGSGRRFKRCCGKRIN